MFAPFLVFATAISGVAEAGDVLVPTFTPKTMGDFSPAEKLTAETMSALSQEGVDFVTPAEIQRRAGEIADGCADRTDCTETLWRHFPGSSLAVVGSVTWNEGLLDTRVMFYGPDDASPLEIVARKVPEKGTAAFAAEVAKTARDLLELVPDRDAGVLAIAAPPKSGGGGRGADAKGASSDYSDLDQPSGPPAKASSKSGDDDRQNRGLPPALWERYKASGLSYREWKDEALVRAGCLIVEVHAGAVFGDVERSYDTRVAIDQVTDGSGEATFEEIGSYQYDAFVRGSAFSAGVSVGFVPLWWLEVSVYGGAEIGRRRLSTGWEQYYSAESGFDTVVLKTSDSFGPVPSTMAVIQPRLRLYTLPSGPVKPYGLLGMQMRIYDAFDDSQLSKGWDYPTREGGVGLGLTAGGGLAFDAPRGAIGFIEVPWTHLMSPRPFENQEGTVRDVPRQELPSGQTLAVRAGIGFRLF